MTRDNCNETEQNVNTFSAWIEAGARGVVELGTAHAPEQALRPALSTPRTPDEITFAVGASQGRDKFVESYEGLTLTDLATMLTEHGRILHMPADPGDPKADLPLITASPSLDGRHADESRARVRVSIFSGGGLRTSSRTPLTAMSADSRSVWRSAAFSFLSCTSRRRVMSSRSSCVSTVTTSSAPPLRLRTPGFATAPP